MFLNNVHFVKEQAFSKSFCDNLIKIGEQKYLETAKINSGDQNNRKSQVAWIEDKSIEREITKVINEANINSNWNFLLREFEPLQYTVYNESDFYDWHIDSRLKPYENGLIRKLSFTISLNEDYEGGQFEICLPHPVSKKNQKIKKSLKQGSIIVFPSHTWHKVNKVTSGIRKTLVGWIVGKPFV